MLDGKYRRLLPALILVAAAGCDVQRDDAAPNGGIDVEQRQWDCEVEEARLTCGAAMLAADGEAGAYACGVDEERAQCPAIDEVLRIAETIDDDAALERFTTTPWACLLTGEHQRECVKDFGVTPQPPTEPEEPGASEPEPGGDNSAEPEPDEPSSTGSATPPTIPSDCQPESWEPYFCDLATYQYALSGVDIEFPCEIFDVSVPFSDTVADIPASAGSAEPGAPSCSDGEWGMREQAWLDAVTQGCTNLNDPILVMCQQGANHAPSTGKCVGTGTW